MLTEAAIGRTAQGMIERHGPRAAGFARLRVEACLRHGHNEAAAMWERIRTTIIRISGSDDRHPLETP